MSTITVDPNTHMGMAAQCNEDFRILHQIDEDVQELLWNIVQCVKATNEEICQKRRHCMTERFERDTQGSLRSSSAIPPPEGPINESISENKRRSWIFHQCYTQCISKLYSMTATESNNRPVSNQQTSTSRTNIPQRAIAPGPDGPDPNGGGGGMMMMMQIDAGKITKVIIMVKAITTIEIIEEKTTKVIGMLKW